MEKSLKINFCHGLKFTLKKEKRRRNMRESMVDAVKFSYLVYNLMMLFIKNCNDFILKIILISHNLFYFDF